MRTLRAAVAESLGVEEAAVKRVVKQTLAAALEAAKARSPQPPPSEVSDDSGAAAPALVIDVGSPRKRDRSRGRAPTVDAELTATPKNWPLLIRSYLAYLLNWNRGRLPY